jgi:hypothetical protein
MARAKRHTVESGTATIDYSHRGRLSGITEAPIRHALMPTVGAHGGDLRITNMDSINNCRMTAGSKARIRVKADVKPTGGRMDQAGALSHPLSTATRIPNARHARRRIAQGTQRAKG